MLIAAVLLWVVVIAGMVELLVFGPSRCPAGSRRAFPAERSSASATAHHLRVFWRIEIEAEADADCRQDRNCGPRVEG
jgi:hypothetical protein